MLGTESAALPPDVRKVFDLPNSFTANQGLCPPPGDSIKVNHQRFIIAGNAMPNSRTWPSIIDRAIRQALPHIRRQSRHLTYIDQLHSKPHLNIDSDFYGELW